MHSKVAAKNFKYGKSTVELNCDSETQLFLISTYTSRARITQNANPFLAGPTNSFSKDLHLRP